MAHPLPEIPGYYYDREKKKYFKVLKAAQGLNIAYSSEDVKKRKTLDSSKDQLERDKRRIIGRISQSEILNSFLPGGILAREYGRSHVDMSKILALKLKFCGRIDPQSNYPTREQHNGIFDIIQTPGQNCSSSLLLASDYEVSISTMVENSKSHEYLAIKVPLFSRSRHQIGPLTSLSTNLHHGFALVTSFGSSTRVVLRLVKLQNESEKISALIEQPCCLGLLPSIDSARRDEIDVLCSVSAPSTSSLLFAMGTTNGIMLIDSQPTIQANRTTYIASRNYINSSFRPKTDILAIDFLNGNPNVLLSGYRRGILVQTDLRVEPKNLTQTTAIRHPSAITHIKSVDPCRVVVSGLNSILCQYDLRFSKLIESERSTSSQPILNYTEYHNDGTIGLGFDVDTDSGLIAAAQETHSGHHPIRLFSLHSDEKYLDSPFEGLSMSPRDTPNQIVKCVRFSQGYEGTRTSLYVGWDHKIYKYA